MVICVISEYDYVCVDYTTLYSLVPNPHRITCGLGTRLYTAILHESSYPVYVRISVERSLINAGDLSEGIVLLNFHHLFSSLQFSFGYEDEQKVPFPRDNNIVSLL